MALPSYLTPGGEQRTLQDQQGAQQGGPQGGPVQQRALMEMIKALYGSKLQPIHGHFSWAQGLANALGDLQQTQMFNRLANLERTTLNTTRWPTQTNQPAVQPGTVAPGVPLTHPSIPQGAVTPGPTSAQPGAPAAAAAAPNIKPTPVQSLSIPPAAAPPNVPIGLGPPPSYGVPPVNPNVGGATVAPPVAATPPAPAQQSGLGTGTQVASLGPVPTAQDLYKSLAGPGGMTPSPLTGGAYNAPPVPPVGSQPNQAGRPFGWTGTMQTPWGPVPAGTGGAGRGSMPYGTFPLTTSPGPWGQAHGALGIGPGNAIQDPKLGVTRQGIELHAATNPALLTHGCVAIGGAQWQQLRAHIQDAIAKGQDPRISYGPNGMSITLNGQTVASATPEQVQQNMQAGAAGMLPGGADAIKQAAFSPDVAGGQAPAAPAAAAAPTPPATAPVAAATPPAAGPPAAAAPPPTAPPAAPTTPVNPNFGGGAPAGAELRALVDANKPPPAPPVPDTSPVAPSAAPPAPTGAENIMTNPLGQAATLNTVQPSPGVIGEPPSGTQVASLAPDIGISAPQRAPVSTPPTAALPVMPPVGTPTTAPPPVPTPALGGTPSTSGGPSITGGGTLTGGIPQQAQQQGLTTAKGSWFGNAPGWHDPGDMDKSGKPLVTASGVPSSTPGIALPDKSTLGKPFEVTTPDGRTFQTTQIDVGPAAHTGRGIDISAGLATKMGYTPGNFPTDNSFKVRPLEGTPTKEQPTLEPSQDAFKQAMSGDKLSPLDQSFSGSSDMMPSSDLTLAPLDMSSSDFSSMSDMAMPFARGGVVDQPTLALLGEAGPEAVVPLTGDTAMNGQTNGNGVQLPWQDASLGAAPPPEMPAVATQGPMGALNGAGGIVAALKGNGAADKAAKGGNGTGTPIQVAQSLRGGGGRGAAGGAVGTVAPPGGWDPQPIIPPNAISRQVISDHDLMWALSDPNIPAQAKSWMLGIKANENKPISVDLGPYGSVIVDPYNYNNQKLIPMPHAGTLKGQGGAEMPVLQTYGLPTTPGGPPSLTTTMPTFGAPAAGTLSGGATAAPPTPAGDQSAPVLPGRRTAPLDTGPASQQPAPTGPRGEATPPTGQEIPPNLAMEGAGQPLGEAAVRALASPAPTGPAETGEEAITAAQGGAKPPSAPPSAEASLTPPMGGVSPAAEAPTPAPEAEAAKPPAPAPTQTAQAGPWEQYNETMRRLNAPGLEYELGQKDVQSYVKQRDDLQQKGKEAEQDLPNLDLAMRLTYNPNFYSGIGADAVLDWKRIKAAIGWDPQAAQAMETFNKVMAKETLSELHRTLAGWAGQVRNSEMAVVSRGLANMYNTPAANRAVIYMMQRMSDQARQVGEVTRLYDQGYAVDAGGKLIRNPEGHRTNSGLQETLSNWYKHNPLLSDQEITKIGGVLSDAEKVQGGATPIQGRNTANVKAAVFKGTELPPAEPEPTAKAPSAPTQTFPPAPDTAIKELHGYMAQPGGITAGQRKSFEKYFGPIDKYLTPQGQ